jgi:arabinofuranosyltransferase
LLLTTRLDLALLVAPACVYVFYKIIQLPQRFSLMRATIFGMMPFLLWEIFSLTYYGFFLPNTYYAKTNHGIPPRELLLQGFNYFYYSWTKDTLTLVVIAAALVVPWLFRRVSSHLFSLGIALYLCYVVRVGGDFMGGRFFGAALVTAVFVLVECLPAQLSKNYLPFMASAIIFLGFRVSDQNILILLGAREPTTIEYVTNSFGGVLNERHFYFKYFGLLNTFSSYLATKNLANPFPAQEIPQKPEVVLRANPGVLGFRGVRGAHIIDLFALGDPLLAHIDADYDPKWRIGHFFRTPPQGYYESLKSGRNLFVEPKIGAYYETLKSLIRDPLFSWTRWQHILRHNLGAYESLLTFYRRYEGSSVPLARLSLVKPPGFNWNAPSNVVIKSGEQKLITLPPHPRATELEISLDNNDYYNLRFLSKGELVAQANIVPDKVPRSGLSVHKVNIPSPEVAAKIDAVLVEPFLGDHRYAIGHMVWY